MMKRSSRIRLLSAGTALCLSGLGACIGSTAADVTASAPVGPTVTTQPIALVVFLADTIRMSVVATGTAPLTYQWYKDSVAIAGATKDTLKVFGAAYTDSGKYFATVTNTVSSASTNIVKVTVRPHVSSTAWWQDGGAAISNSRAYSTSVADESAVLVQDTGEFTTTAPNVQKVGASSDLTASRDRGQNAAVRSTGGSRIYVTSGVVNVTADGAAALYAAGGGTKLQATSLFVTALGNGSPAISASDGATVTISGGSLNSNGSDAIDVSAPVTGTATASIALSGGVTVASNGTLLHVFNRGAAALTLDGEQLSGRVVVDAGGVGTVVLQNNSTLSGAIAAAGLTLASGSAWTVTGASSVNALAGATISGTSITNILGGGFTVTYDGSLAANAALGKKTYTLAGGGQLVPR
jgi:hypothetical protein